MVQSPSLLYTGSIPEYHLFAGYVRTPQAQYYTFFGPAINCPTTMIIYVVRNISGAKIPNYPAMALLHLNIILQVK